MDRLSKQTRDLIKPSLRVQFHEMLKVSLGDPGTFMLVFPMRMVSMRTQSIKVKLLKKVRLANATRLCEVLYLGKINPGI